MMICQNFTVMPKIDATVATMRQKKTQRNYSVHYVDSKVNGKFGKALRARALNEEKFSVLPLVKLEKN